jgi:hypothetical protein
MNLLYYGDNLDVLRCAFVQPDSPPLEWRLRAGNGQACTTAG